MATAYILTIVLIGFSALFSGLTLGLMGLDVHALQRKVKLGNKHAKVVYPIRRKGNLLLTTLLLGNVAVNAILAIFLGTIATGLVAGVISTALIFLFGEIIPQAVVSRHALAFGAKTAWIIRILMFIFLPITWPIAWALDRALGQELPTIFSRNELLEVIGEHQISSDSDVDTDEGRIIHGALKFSTKTVADVMTPRSMMTLLSLEDKITLASLKRLRESGHSRFPVYSETKDNIVGMLFLKSLVGRNYKGKKVKNYYKKDVNFVRPDDVLDDVLNTFLETRRHLFIVKDEFGGIDGLISIEDIIEEIVGVEIVDEFDRVVDLRKFARNTQRRKGVIKKLN
ncbi:DUF21 domain-containing protein [Candidatus Uhrbacteria bacterium]|nr:DUF21 domain-containing protein [Candidatus Uhrbacteria bacterium]